MIEYLRGLAGYGTRSYHDNINGGQHLQLNETTSKNTKNIISIKDSNKDTTHRHSIVHFGGQFTLMTSNKQIERKTATIMFKWQQICSKQLIFHRYAHVWSVTLVWYSKSANK